MTDLDPEALLAQAQTALGPAHEWAGRCYEIACALVEYDLVQGTAVYGHFVGPIHPKSYFRERRGHPFVQHGWVLLEEGTIVDPTRWAFEARLPYIAVFPPGAPEQRHYDEGGNRFRAVTHSRRPNFDPNEIQYRLPEKLLPTGAFLVMEWLLMPDYSEQDPGEFSVSQLCWLANAPYDTLQGQAAPIYEALEHVGLLAHVPIDNWRRAQREKKAR